MKKRLSGWKAAQLSMAGRMVLVKAVPCSMPLYYISIYRMPVGVARKMEQIWRNFLWGDLDGKRRVHTVKWEVVKMSKKAGGLGINDIIMKNQAMLLKWWWALTSRKNGLWRRMVVAKYKIADLIEIDADLIKEKRMSPTWREIVRLVKTNGEVSRAFKNGSEVELGQGSKILFWSDKWCGVESLKEQYPRLYRKAVNKKATVAEMGSWDKGVWFWKVEMMRNMYTWDYDSLEEMLRGLEHIQPKLGQEDKLIWKYSSDGVFSTQTLMKEALKIKEETKGVSFNSAVVWSGLAPPRVGMFMWKIMRRAIPTKMELARRKALPEGVGLSCILCGEQDETLDHVMLKCGWADKLWRICIQWWGMPWVQAGSLQQQIEGWQVWGVKKTFKSFWKTILLAVLWSIWLERNDRIFKERITDVRMIGEIVKRRVASWIKIRNNLCGTPLEMIVNNIEEVRSGR